MIRRHLPVAATALATAAALTGCATSTPRAPPAPPANAVGGFVGAAPAAATADSPPAGWWRLFRDPALDAHVQRALAANLDLRVALANLETARAAARQVDAARPPATVLESGAGPTRADRQPSTSSVPKTSYELGATVAFEIDLFGRLRSAADAADADAEAVAAARDAARITVVADTVAAYLDLCGAEAGARLGQNQLAIQQRSYDIVRDQLAAGEVSPLEVSQATLLRDQSRAALPGLEASRRSALFRLAVLQGRAPAEAGGFDTPCAALPAIASPLPVGDGAGLIARRPDLREAEHRLAAAAARVDVAVADLYPRIQLGGSGGLIAGGSNAFLTPLITWTFLNQAAPRARIAAARGATDAALANWDRVLLRALHEVEIALSDYRAARENQAALTTALAEAERVATRARARTNLGADNYLVVIDAERSRNVVANQLLTSELAVSRAQIALFRALGGGWETAAL